MVSYQSAKEEIKRAADIVELIGEFVQLKKAGRNHVGLCPFHSEKDPSFTVTPERQTFHCFGCKKGGDIFSFWMEYHSSTFPEALRDLAERYHVTISEGFSAAKERETAYQREALYKINEKALDYFIEALNHPTKGASARDYLEGRSISKETISE
ncbi:MAG: CHC2 zinc finger domain-containing protein, partial [Thermodesulfobacteriota bacterium]|nr:CHC2 zinc finger domain-containing protein [Thermodesulfobacteriota bacterium]